ncbi:MAG TPA: glycosyltransferase family 39 protein [bacterium]|nr:glycosyltransferase family 39 protein [bacterium]
MSRKSGATSRKKAQTSEAKAAGTQGPGPATGSGLDLFRRLPSWWPVPLFMLIGLYFRLSTTLWEPLIYPDSMQYMHQAREIRSGVFFEKDYDLDQGFIKSRRVPPLYSFLLAPFAKTQADMEKVGIITSLLLSSLTFIPLYWTVLMIFSRRAALIACAIFSFQAFVLFFASPILTEAAFTFIFACVIAASTRALIRPGLAAFALCGVLSALLYLTRDVGLTAPPLIAGAALIKFRAIDRLAWKKTAVLVAVLLGSFLLVSSPYFIHIRLRTGHFGLSAQMSNTSITRQIQLEGGDRYERDRMRGVEPALVGPGEARGIGGIIKISPLLIRKVFRNMGEYGLSGGQRFTPFLLAFMLAGCWGLVHEYRSGRDRRKLFLAVWVTAWILAFWVLYSLVTPYMVDERYMYPLTFPAAMLAASGMAWAADAFPRALRKPDGEPLATGLFTALALVLLCVFYVRELPALLYPDSFEAFGGIYPARADWAAMFPLAGAAVLTTLALAPSIRLMLGSDISKGAMKQLVSVLIVFLAVVGAAAMILSRPGAGFMRSLPGLLLFGTGLGLMADLAMARWERWNAYWPAFLSALIVAAAFFAQVPDYLDIRARRSPATLSNKYSSGHKEAAMDIKARGLIPPGKIICERKPFMTYYLDGKLYLGPDHEPIPKSIPEVEDLVASGAIDYLVADSFTFKALRPYLTGLAFSIRPLQGASVIYSRYFPQYDRIITVYDCHKPETELAGRGSAQEHLDAARAYIQQGNMVFAYRELDQALEMEPLNKEVLFLKIQILFIFYQCASRPNTPTLALAPDVLPALEKAAKAYLQLAPDDPNAQSIHDMATQYYQSEMKLIRDFKKQIQQKNSEEAEK